MEPFRLTGQTVTFLAFITVVAIAVAVAAPFGSIVLASLSVMAIGVVLIKAMLRARQWWPLTAVEGTVAVSGLVLVAGGFGVIGYSIATMGIEDGPRIVIGWPYIPAEQRTVRGSSTMRYTDPDVQQKLKDGLRDAGVPYTTVTREGNEYLTWPREHDAAVEAVIEKIVGRTLPNNRNAHFPDAAVQKEFIAWLEQKGIKYEIAKSRGVEHVVWEEGAGDVMSDFIASRSGADCKGKIADAKPGATRC